MLRQSAVIIRPELWGLILSFTGDVVCNLTESFSEPCVLKYRAVCRMFHEQCLTIIQKVMAAPCYLPSFDSGRKFLEWNDLKLIFRRILLYPANIVEIDLSIQDKDLKGLGNAECIAIASCKSLRSLNIRDVMKIEDLKLIGNGCRKLKRLSLKCWEARRTLLQLTAFFQLTSLNFRFGLDRFSQTVVMPANLRNRASAWINLKELMGDFLRAGFGELVSCLPNLSSYTEISCPEPMITLFVGHCKDKPIAEALETLTVMFCDNNLDADQNNNKTSRLSLLLIFQTFKNLRHLTIRHSLITFRGIETVQALSQLTQLETLDLKDNRMFFGGNVGKISKWVFKYLPFFPQNLTTVNFSDWWPDESEHSEHSRIDWATTLRRLSRRIKKEIRTAIPGVTYVSCNHMIIDDESDCDDDADDEVEGGDDDDGNS